MPSVRRDKKINFLLDFAIACTALFLLWFVLRYLFYWVLPFLFAYFIAALMQPTVWLLHKRLHINRKAAGVIGVLLFFLVLAALAAFGLTKLFSELAAVIGLLPSLITKAAKSFEGLAGQWNLVLNSLPLDLSNQLVTATKNASSELMKFSSLSSGVVTFAWSTVSQLPNILLNLLVTIIAAVFISSDYPQIRGFMMRQLPLKYQDWAIDIKNFFFVTLARLLRAYLTLMVITFAELCVGFLLLRVPHAVMIAALTAIVDILPVLGTGTVIIPWALVEFLTGRWNFALLLLLVYAVIAVVRNILEPKIVGYHIRLYPLVTLISMFVGLKAFGAAGMVLFPLIVIIIKHMQDTGKIRLWKTADISSVGGKAPPGPNKKA